jgi:phage shock protein PspC (stress-responsive transcriptional regulator)
VMEDVGHRYRLDPPLVKMAMVMLAWRGMV